MEHAPSSFLGVSNEGDEQVTKTHFGIIDRQFGTCSSNEEHKQFLASCMPWMLGSRFLVSSFEDAIRWRLLCICYHPHSLVLCIFENVRSLFGSPHSKYIGGETSCVAILFHVYSGFSWLVGQKCQTKCDPHTQSVQLHIAPHTSFKSGRVECNVVLVLGSIPSMLNTSNASVCMSPLLAF